MIYEGIGPLDTYPYAEYYSVKQVLWTFRQNIVSRVVDLRTGLIMFWKPAVRRFHKAVKDILFQLSDI